MKTNTKTKMPTRKKTLKTLAYLPANTTGLYRSCLIDTMVSVARYRPTNCHTAESSIKWKLLLSTE